jgi:hypothetical protein
LDLDEVPRLYLTGGIVEDAVVVREERSDTDHLIKYESDDEYQGYETLQPDIAYWTPKGGDIRILDDMVKLGIEETTGTSLFAEPAEARYRLNGGEYRTALQKLLNLEPLLVNTPTAVSLNFD